MRLEFVVIAVTIFFIVNIYYDGYYLEYVKGFRKYAHMALIAFAGLSIYLMLKKRPTQTKSLFESLGGIIRYMPIDKNAKQVLEPFFDMTHEKVPQEYGTPAMLSLPMNQKYKRSVSEAKKKYVASSQQWKCKHCSETLDATYEIDHIQPLHKGGNNEVSNLECLCRKCHAKKTLEDRIF